MANKTRAALNTTITEALVTGQRRTTAAAVRGLMTDILDSLAVYGDLHRVDGVTDQPMDTTFEALTSLDDVGQSLGVTITPAEGKIACAVAGTYRVDVMLRCTGEAAITYTIRLLVNGAPVVYLIDRHLTVGTELFTLHLTGFVQTSDANQTIILQGASDDAGGAAFTVVQGSFVVQRVA
jgi:hypothetical protein